MNDNKKNTVCVLGSINVDMVVDVNEFPKPGQTILGNNFQKFFGGKGANQAVAARKLGAFVHILGKTGRDTLGKEYMDNLEQNQIAGDGITYSETKSTGMAIINVDAKGENNIVVVAGANEDIDTQDIENAREKLAESKVAVSQFEVPVPATQRFFELAKQNECITIFNPAPAQKIPEDMFPYIDILIPNEGELGCITGRKTESMEEIAEAAKTLLEKGMSYVLVTLGSKGSLLVTEEKSIHIPSEKVKAVDTTAAGDSYVGALAASLAKENKLCEEAMQKSAYFATKVAAHTVQRKGAQASLPYLDEVK